MASEKRSRKKDSMPEVAEDPNLTIKHLVILFKKQDLNFNTRMGELSHKVEAMNKTTFDRLSLIENRLSSFENSAEFWSQKQGCQMLVSSLSQMGNEIKPD